ncbi:MAG: hypothetical protein ACRCVS_01430 [Fusobacteriaceae bacterium]
MKKWIVIIMCCLSVQSFTEIRDGIKIFSKEKIESLNSKIKEFESKNEIRFFLVTNAFGEDFSIENPEKAIILSIKKDNLGTISVEQNFTRDIKIEENEEEVNLLIDNIVGFLKNGEIDKYVEEFIVGINDILQNDGEKENSGYSFAENKWKIIKWIVVILTFLNIIGRIRGISKKKRGKNIGNN